MESRLQRLKQSLIEQGLDAVLVSSLPNIIYLTGYSQFLPDDQGAFFLLVTQEEHYIFTYSFYLEIAERDIGAFKLIPISRMNPIGKPLAELVKKHNLQTIGFEANDVDVATFQRLTSETDKKIFQPTTIVNQMRIYKTTDEIERIKKACEIGDKVFNTLLTEIKAGVTEKALTAAIDIEIKRNLADNSFSTIAAFGANAASPHHAASDKVVEEHNVVLCDFGIRYQSYCSDMTRTVFFGKAPADRKKVYETVKDAQQKAIDYIEKQLAKGEKIIAKEVDLAARNHILAQGYPEKYLMGHGHGIGLEVHELPHLFPISENLVEEDMAFTIEPGIYIPGDLGVRIEDLFVIQNNKLIPLTHSPKQLIEI